MYLPTGSAFERGDEGYEQALQATVWNARIPDRSPKVIVCAESVADVLAAVRNARADDLTIGISSGGHGWSASHLIDGGMLIDVSQLDSLEVNWDKRTAVVGPGKRCDELAAELETQGLFFPASPFHGVAVGGYLLQGGYGWNGRVLGLACESVTGVDVVTADGELVHASATQNPDLYWSARGAGPEFFGVVTRFHLQVFDQPMSCGSSLYAYPIEVMDDIYTWARSIGPQVDRHVELQIVMSQSFPALGIDRPTILITSPVFASSEAEAQSALAILGTCPVLDQALFAVPYAPAHLSEWYDAVMESFPAGLRYAADTMWTSAPARDLLPGLHRIAETLPPAPSHCMWTNWGPSPTRPDMAHTLEDEIRIALYSAWTDPAEDRTRGVWPAAVMAAMSGIASGTSLSDADLALRPARFTTDEAMARLDTARAVYDPDGRFGTSSAAAPT